MSSSRVHWHCTPSRSHARAVVVVAVSPLLLPWRPTGAGTALAFISNHGDAISERHARRKPSESEGPPAKRTQCLRSDIPCAEVRRVQCMRASSGDAGLPRQQTQTRDCIEYSTHSLTRCCISIRTYRDTIYTVHTARRPGPSIRLCFQQHPPNAFPSHYKHLMPPSPPTTNTPFSTPHQRSINMHNSLNYPPSPPLPSPPPLPFLTNTSQNSYYTPSHNAPSWTRTTHTASSNSQTSTPGT